MNQEKLNKYWILKEGDKLKGKKIININFIENKYNGDHLKIIQLEDKSEYFLDNEGLKKVQPSE